MRKTTLLIAALAAVLLLPACAKKPVQDSTDVAGQTGEVPAVQATELPEVDALFDHERHTREGTEKAIEGYEAALAANPDRADGKDIRVRLSVLYYGLAYYYDRAESKKHKMGTYLLGKEHGWDAIMGSNPEFKAAIDGGTKIVDAIPLIRAQDVDAAYWTALNWARWGEQKGILRVAMDIPKVRGINDRILEVGEDYYHAAVHRFFGAFFVEIPQFAGQDHERAKAHFLRGMELAPTWPENEVNYAWYYARRSNNKELYVELLTKVIETPIPEDSVFRFEYTVARADAEEMLAKVDDLF
ncbi:MAG: hypothetical protein GY898_24585 [Proteobacteria bacterium]|nr:hypothetical protein [Pseudomonadota bacterium]